MSRVRVQGDDPSARGEGKGARTRVSSMVFFVLGWSLVLVQARNARSVPVTSVWGEGGVSVCLQPTDA
jgi:hypothetical protein